MRTSAIGMGRFNAKLTQVAISHKMHAIGVEDRKGGWMEGWKVEGVENWRHWYGPYRMPKFLRTELLRLHVY